MTLSQAPKSSGLRAAILVALTPVAAYLAWWESVTTVAASGLDPPASEAKAVLRHQPLDAAALRVLAFALQTPEAETNSLLRLSGTVSRHDGQTQLHLFNDRMLAGDFSAALGHYDALLSTTPDANGTLYGFLTIALGEPRIRAGLTAYAGRAWFRSFLRTASGPGGNPRQTLALARETGVLSDPDWRNEVSAPLITGLVAAGALGEAQGIADRLGLGDWRALSFSPTTMDSRLGSLAWRLEGQVAGAANLYTADILGVTAEPQRRARVAQRLTAWSPGRYRLAYVVEASRGPLADVTWRVTCQAGQPAGASVVGQSPGASGARAALVTLGQDCLVQEWALWVEGADSQTPSSAFVSQVAVEAL